MIPATLDTRQTPAWQREMAAAITDPAQLLAALKLDPSLIEPARAAARLFALRVPQAFVARMRQGDPDDPLLRQVLPLDAETSESGGFTSDPLDERDALRAPGLLQKYSGRALLVTTGACAVHCRYCFRREFPYSEQADGGSRWQQAVAWIAAEASVEELILSGGDPLSLADARLASLTGQLAGVPHLRRLRIHSRLPVVLPSRVDDGLLAWLGTVPWPVVLVLHANHPQEIDSAVVDACRRLRAAGVTLLNQSVLLRGVNTDARVLAELSHRLFDAGVLPYYLHLLDRVRGTAHFEVGEARARELVATLAATLPGYLVPRLAREIPGAPGKVVLAPESWPRSRADQSAGL